MYTNIQKFGDSKIYYVFKRSNLSLKISALVSMLNIIAIRK